MLKAITCSVAVLLAATAVSFGAQTKTIPGEMKSVTATVEAIELHLVETLHRVRDIERHIRTVRFLDGHLSRGQVGDKINAKYYDNVVVQLKQPGTPDVNAASGALVPVEGAPAGTMSYQRTITATITAIDPKAPSITFTGPKGWKYSSRVQDPAALSKVKVGDKVDITWTMALLMSIEGS